MQTITGLDVGKRYRVTFDLSANPDGPNGMKRLTVSASNGAAESRFYDLTDANSPANMLYQTNTYDFIAGNTYADLAFRSAVFDPYGVVLDNVTISVVPEPAVWGLMLTGFALTGASVRRRRRARHVTA